MLRDHAAIATIPVKDLHSAKRFYEGTLELEPLPGEEEEALAYECGGSKVFVYKSNFAGTNMATAVTWEVGDHVQEIVRALKAKGVSFEHYDMPGMKLEGDVHVSGKMKAAWFKDPDGNILALVGQ